MYEVIRALTWTFIHSLWQGLLAALFSAIIISCTRNSTARLRYNLLCLVMILFFASSILTFFTQWRAHATRVASPYFIVADGAPVISTTKGLLGNFKVWVNTNSDIVLLVWVFFFFLSCIRLVTGFAAVNRLRHYKTHPVSKEWKTKLEQLQLVIGIRCSVALLQSELVKVPVALGIFKPIIFIPLGLLSNLPAEQVETILLHELAHIRRRDYLVNLLQHAVEAIFFFNPAVRWVSFLVRQEREACCDDMVLANCNQKTDYLHALISFQEYSYGRNAYAMGISCKRHYLFNRIKRMVTNKNNGINFFEKIALLSSVILFSAFSYILNKPVIKSVPVTIQKSAASVIPINDSNPKHSSIKIETKKITHLKKINRDTFPAKKDTGNYDKNIRVNEPLLKLTGQEQAAKDADAALEQIIQIKNQIGLKKESIGVKKAKLPIANGKEKDEIMKEIDRERSELEDQRRELERRRAQWQSLRKEAQKKSTEEKNFDLKTQINNAIFNSRSVPLEVFGQSENDISRKREAHISADFTKKLDFKIDKNKPPKWEHKFITNPQPKDPLPFELQTPPEKKSEPPGRKVPQ